MATKQEYLLFIRYIRRLARTLDAQSSRIDREIGLTMPQLLVLTALGQLGEVTSRALSAEADLSPPVVVGVLDKLEAKGLIERYRSQRDRRIVHARLTERGRAALHFAPDPLGAELNAVFNGMSDTDRAALMAGLARFAVQSTPGGKSAGPEAGQCI
jgi:DNA-binding MarR family transcriptional regulator